MVNPTAKHNRERSAKECEEGSAPNLVIYVDGQSPCCSWGNQQVTTPEAFESCLREDLSLVEDACDYDFDQRFLLQNDGVITRDDMRDEPDVILLNSHTIPTPKFSEPSSSETNIKNLRKLQQQNEEKLARLKAQRKDLDVLSEERTTKNSKGLTTKNSNVTRAETRTIPGSCMDVKERKKSRNKTGRRPRALPKGTRSRRKRKSPAKREPRRNVRQVREESTRNVDIWMAKDENMTKEEFLGVLGLMAVNKRP